MRRPEVAGRIDSFEGDSDYMRRHCERSRLSMKRGEAEMLLLAVVKPLLSSASVNSAKVVPDSSGQLK